MPKNKLYGWDDTVIHQGNQMTYEKYYEVLFGTKPDKKPISEIIKEPEPIKNTIDATSGLSKAVSDILIYEEKIDKAIKEHINDGRIVYSGLPNNLNNYFLPFLDEKIKTPLCKLSFLETEEDIKRYGAVSRKVLVYTIDISALKKEYITTEVSKFIIEIIKFELKYQIDLMESIPIIFMSGREKDSEHNTTLYHNNKINKISLIFIEKDTYSIES